MRHELTPKEYAVLLQLYNEYNEAFKALPNSIHEAFYARLYAKEAQNAQCTGK